MISNAAGFPVPEKPFPVMSNTVPCYVQHLPCYGINREEYNIYLILGDKICIFAGKAADNREEKFSFPVLSLFRAGNRENARQPVQPWSGRQNPPNRDFRDRIDCERGVVPGDGIEPPTLRFSIACSTN